MPENRAIPAPPMPWEIMLKEGANWFFEPAYDAEGKLERMVLVFVAGQLVGADPVSGDLMTALMPPAVRIPFPAEAWEKFKEQAQKDGNVINIPIAKTIINPDGGPLH